MNEPTKRITRALRCEIVKPLDSTWEDAGRRLRDLRSIAHRLYTAAALAAIRIDRAQLKGTPEINPKTKKPLHPQTGAYQAVEEELKGIRAWAVAKGNGTLAAIDVPSCMRTAIGNAGYAGFARWRADKGNVRAPTWKRGAPLPCPGSMAKLELDASGKLSLRVKLASRGTERFAVIAGKGSHWERLRSIARKDEGVKLGDVKLTYSEREKKWYALISYSEPAPSAPAECDPRVTMVIHRGERNLLVCGSTNRTSDFVLATGCKLRAFKRRTAERRKSLQAVTRAERGNGAHGHGRKRRYEINDRISGAERAFVRTLCQQMGAAVVARARQFGAGRILIEEFGGLDPSDERGERMSRERFPFAELKTCIEWALKKHGLELGEYDHRNISRACPRCGHNADANRNLRTGIFHCVSCRYERRLDTVSVIHALRRANNGHAGLWERQLEIEERLAGAAAE